MAQDVITINNSLNTISNELGNVAKEVTRDVADVAETVGDGMVIGAPVTGPAAPAVAGIGATISAGGIVVNVGIDLIEGDVQSAIKRTMTRLLTSGLSSLAKNSSHVDKNAEHLIESIIQINENVIDSSIQYHQEQIKEEQ